MPQMVKNLPAIWETWVHPNSREDPLEKGLAAHSSILAWRIPWTEEPSEPQSMGLKELDLTKWLTWSHFHAWNRVSGKLLYSTESSGQCSVMTQRGAMGVQWEGGSREGIYVYIQLIHTVVRQKVTQHCKCFKLYSNFLKKTLQSWKK